MQLQCGNMYQHRQWGLRWQSCRGSEWDLSPKVCHRVLSIECSYDKYIKTSLGKANSASGWLNGIFRNKRLNYKIIVQLYKMLVMNSAALSSRLALSFRRTMSYRWALPSRWAMSPGDNALQVTMSRWALVQRLGRWHSRIKYDRKQLITDGNRKILGILNHHLKSEKRKSKNDRHSQRRKEIT